MRNTVVSTARGARGAARAFRATAGSLECIASTKRLALDGLETSAESALERLTAGTTIGRWNGHLFVISPDLHGWRYWLETFGPGFSQVISETDRISVYHAVIHHLAQNVWNAETDDRAFLSLIPLAIRGELASWIGFQRAFIRERTAGTPELEIHRIACERPEIISYDRA